MAGIVEEIFKLSGDSADIVKKLQAVQGSYQELTEEQTKQLKTLNELEKREKALLDARARSTNPTMTMKYSKEIGFLGTQISELKKQTDSFTTAETKAVAKTNELSKSISNAFKGTVIAGAAKEVDKIEKSLDNAGNATQEVITKTVSLKAQLSALKVDLENATDPAEIQRLAQEAGLLADQIRDAADAAAVFATDSPFKAVGNAIGSVASKLLSLDFKGAADQSELLVTASKKITFKESVQGVKDLGKTFLNFGKALLANPFFLLTTVITLIITNFDKLKNSTGLLGTVFKFVGDVIEYVIDQFFALTDALGITDHAMTELYDNLIKRSQEYAEITKKQAERQIAVAKALGQETEKAEIAKQQAYIKTLQIALMAMERQRVAGAEQSDDEKALVQTILDARNEIQVIEATAYKKRKDEAKKYADEVSKVFDGLDKKIRELATKQTEFNIKFKFEEGSQAQIDEIYKLRKKLEDQELKELTENALKVAKTKTDIAKAEEKLSIINNITRTNRENDFATASLDALLARGKVRIEREKENLTKLNQATNASELDRTRQQATIDNDAFDKQKKLLEDNIAFRRMKGLDVVAQERELNDLIITGKLQLANEEKEILQQTYNAANAEIDFEKDHQNALLTLRNKANSNKLFADVKFEKDRLAAIQQLYGLESQQAQAQQDKIALLEKEARKQRLLEIVGYFEQISNAAFAATKQIIAAKQEEVDRTIALQQKRVDEIRNIADKGNAQVLELEQKRLDDLTKKRENYVKQQQALAAVELVANTAIAVSKAAAEGGVAAGITIAAALLALVAGLASARSIASQAAYYDGGLYSGQGYTGNGNPRGESNALGAKPYVYHNEEYIFKHQITRKYKDIFQDVHHGRVDLREWQHKASMYDQMIDYRPFTTTAPLQMNNAPIVNNIIEVTAMNSKLDELIWVTRMSKPNITFDAQGVTEKITSVMARNEHIKNLAKP